MLPMKDKSVLSRDCISLSPADFFTNVFSLSITTVLSIHLPQMGNPKITIPGKQGSDAFAMAHLTINLAEIQSTRPCVM